MAILSWSTSTPYRPSCPAIRCSCSTKSTRSARKPDVTERRTPGEHRLAQLAEPEKDVAAGTKTIVLGPYLTRKRRVRSDSDAADAKSNPRGVEARLDEATGLAAAID